MCGSGLIIGFWARIIKGKDTTFLYLLLNCTISDSFKTAIIVLENLNNLFNNLAKSTIYIRQNSSYQGKNTS